MRSRVLLKLCAVLCACLPLGACGSGGGGSSGAAAAPTTAASSQTPSSSSTAASSSTTTTTTTTTTTATASAQPATRLCVAASLSLSYLGQRSAAGHGELGFALHNTGSAACHTYGYPGVQFVDKAGQPLPINPTRTTRDFFGATQLAELVLQPGATVSFRIGVTHGTQAGAGCKTAYALHAIAPDDTATITTPIPGGAFECQSATVSPLQPGTGAFIGP